jgi:hypothetical protein
MMLQLRGGSQVSYELLAQRADERERVPAERASPAP